MSKGKSFHIGDDTDVDHCTALTHEFLRCDDSFVEFKLYATLMIMKGKSRMVSYKAYNAYAAFIHHLYEFLVGCHARNIGVAKISDNIGEKIGGKDRQRVIDGFITEEIQKILNKKRRAILKGTAPAWENNIGYYPKNAPRQFASDFRHYRNKVSGHVSHERSSKLSLSDFYARYHKYLHMLYQDSKPWWGKRGDNFPGLKTITDFSVLIVKES